jgi:hypothetical protein
LPAGFWWKVRGNDAWEHWRWVQMWEYPSRLTTHLRNRMGIRVLHVQTAQYPTPKHQPLCCVVSFEWVLAIGGRMSHIVLTKSDGWIGSPPLQSRAAEHVREHWLQSSQVWHHHERSVAHGSVRMPGTLLAQSDGILSLSIVLVTERSHKGFHHHISSEEQMTVKLCTNRRIW